MSVRNLVADSSARPALCFHPPLSLAALFLFFALAGACAAQSAPVRLDVRLVTDEADAVLAILAKTKAKQPVVETDWQRLFASEGYRRLQKRETAMHRAFTDLDFRAFVLSPGLLARADVLAETLAKWRAADVQAAARRSLAYLPENAHIRAKVYPVIKPRQNSFVFETATDPAIFLYLDPEQTAAQFENVLAHEMHHIGYGTGCPDENEAEAAARPAPVRAVRQWISAFGEGLAMLAAAGGPDIHPHAVSKPEDRARWDHDVAQFNDDLKTVEKFFLDVLSGRLASKEEIDRQAFTFFGVQGPWYTVGWKMAATIEKLRGRPKLIECLCDPANFLRTYNQAAAEQNQSLREALALWSPALIERVTVASHGSAGEVR